MPSELQRVAQGLLDALNQIERIVPYLHSQAQQYRQAAGWVGGMSNNVNAQRAAMQLDEAARCCEEAAHFLDRARQPGIQWVQQMVSGVRAAEPSSGPAGERPLRPGGNTPPAERRPDGDQTEPRAHEPREGGSAGDDGSRRDEAPPPKISDEEAWGLFRKLPVRVERFGYREKTRGIWRDDNGDEHPLVSGQHDDQVGEEYADLYRQAEEFAVQHRLGNPPGTLSVTSHVEIKFAMLMWRRGLRDATVVINKETCKGDSSCDEWLDKFLPPGAKLTVYGPNNFKQTYPKPPKPEGS
ncbi:DddA-like double-stranded DNA deaminase toxin [Kribbella solani]|uniref:DddA-like double-stranded DNA deaminase toxin n=1 Tax=Kribbella solani TaxID=236067 RepID=UPI0029B66BEC|nr:DddA-like double-stranded DNA deaminase toxin [Kribbella solani]MDX2972600.1 SCP1.201-like deaminase [Kribbella solani]